MFLLERFPTILGHRDCVRKSAGRSGAQQGPGAPASDATLPAGFLTQSLRGGPNLAQCYVERASNIDIFGRPLSLHWAKFGSITAIQNGRKAL